MLGGKVRMGYSKSGDVITVTMNQNDWILIMVALGITQCFTLTECSKDARRWLELANSLNKGNPFWTPL
jgi:hypothetical protein